MNNNQLAVPGTIGALSGLLARNLIDWLAEQTAGLSPPPVAPISHSTLEELVCNCTAQLDWAEVTPFLRSELQAATPVLIGAVAYFLLRGFKEVWNGLSLTIAYVSREPDTTPEEGRFRASAKKLSRPAAYKADFH